MYSEILYDVCSTTSLLHKNVSLCLSVERVELLVVTDDRAELYKLLDCTERVGVILIG